jgi:hypothetical protein
VARPLAPVLATSTEALGALSAVRELPGGRLLVNDPVKKRVLLMDSTLAVLGVVADSTTSAASYGTRPGGLIAYRGDSTLFVDPSSLSMLVIDPAGKIARVMAAPRPNDVAFLVGGAFGNPGFDAQGRLIYRTLNRNFGPPPQPGQPFTPPPQPDTVPIIRFDLATRKLDTAAFIKTPRFRMNVLQTERGMSMSPTIDPIPVVDDWAVLPDGGIALVRGRDYHVDFIDADGTRRSTAKIPFDWQRLSDDDKTAIIDSARKVVEAQRAAGGGPGGGATAGGPAAITGTGGATVVTVTGGPGGPQTQVGGPPPPAGTVQLPPPSFFPASELADYRPAFAGGSVRADAEGRVWVRTIPTKPLAGGAEYDVIDRDGKLVDRVAIPRSTTIVGFGPKGIVYLGIRDAAGVHVVRARAK